MPKLLVELMELIYRFIFVLAETASNIRLAQESRLGYQGFRPVGELPGHPGLHGVLRAWRKGQSIYTALESRGYTGSLTTLAGDYAPGLWLLPLTGAVAAGQLLVLCLERMAVR